MFNFKTRQLTEEMTGMGVCKPKAPMREELGWTRVSEQSVWMRMRELGGQSIPAVSDIEQYYKENMDKTEAYKVPGAEEGRS